MVKRSIEDFLRDKALQELSPATIHSYRADLEMFARDMEALGVKVEDVTVEILKEWLWKKKLNGLSPNGLRRLTVLLKNFYGLTKKDLKTPRAKNVKPINVLSNAEMREVHDAAYELRDKTLIAFGYQTGARRKEIQRATWGDIDFEKCMVRLHGKGGKIRNIPLNKEILDILRRYRDSGGPVAPSDPLFVGRRGNPITVYGLHHVLRRLRSRVSIPDAETRVHWHMLRHCFAKHLYQAGVKIRALQQLLGHSSVGITEGYLVMLGCEVAEEFLEAAPALSLNRE